MKEYSIITMSCTAHSNAPGVEDRLQYSKIEVGGGKYIVELHIVTILIICSVQSVQSSSLTKTRRSSVDQQPITLIYCIDPLLISLL